MQQQQNTIRNELRRLESSGVPFIHRIIISGIMEYSAESGAFDYPISAIEAIRQRDIPATPEVVDAIGNVWEHYKTEGK
jgi:hypothetical protein